MLLSSCLIISVVLLLLVSSMCLYVVLCVYWILRGLWPRTTLPAAGRRSSHPNHARQHAGLGPLGQRSWVGRLHVWNPSSPCLWRQHGKRNHIEPLFLCVYPLTLRIIRHDLHILLHPWFRGWRGMARNRRKRTPAVSAVCRYHII